MDLKAYQTQIIELIPLRDEPDFNDLLNKILFGESASDKFLIKMELSRLAKPCLRIIDIRHKVTDQCKLIELGNLKHYLTPSTAKILEYNIKLYGLYTVGAFEAVHEYITTEKNRKALKNRLPIVNEPSEEQCELIVLSQKNERAAPRMFFVCDITITLDNGKVITAQTSNVSISGVKVKLKKTIYFQSKTSMAINFLGLSLEFNDEILKKQIFYQLVKQESDIDGSNYLYLNYADDKKEFLLFIREFIRLNQYKYKLDVHYYCQLAKINALKQIYLAQMNILPICLDINASSPFIFALKNKINEQLLDSWHSEGINHLNLLFSKSRVTKLISSFQDIDSTSIYTFTHIVNDKQYFLSASEEELAEQGLKQIFIKYGQDKKNWCVYHLSLSPYQYKPSRSHNVAEAAPAIFHTITHMATLQCLSNAYPFDIECKLDNDQVKKLNQFVHRNEESEDITPLFTLFSEELRKEERYSYSSNISVSDAKTAYTGRVIDFSCSGLKIKLDKITGFTTSTKLTVNLVDLQKISKKFSLSDLKYKIVRPSSKDIFHLQVSDKPTLDICEQFFSTLVKNNAKHFTCTPLKEKKQPLVKHLIDVAEESFINAVFFISKIGAHFKITNAAIETEEHPLHSLFSIFSHNKNELNCSPLVNNKLYERLINQPLKKADKGDFIIEAIIYISVITDSRQQSTVSSFIDADFTSEQAKIKFIKESQVTGRFYALNYCLRKLPRIDMDCIKSEVKAISRFAIHLVKKLEEELADIEAMIEITDRTEYVISTVEQIESIKQNNHT